MMRRLFLPLLALALGAGPAALAAEHGPGFTSEGAFGTIDKAQAQRGYQVFASQCAACHSIGQVHYRDLELIGLTPEQAAAEALAAGLTLESPLKGAAPSAMGGAIPPDLSGIVAERTGGTRYIYDYLTGYAPAPAGSVILPGHYYNTAFPGGQTAMPNPLHDGAVTYANGAQPSTAQQAADVAEFLTFASDPYMNTRHQIGLRALIFFAFLAVIAIASKRRVWRENA